MQTGVSHARSSTEVQDFCLPACWGWNLSRDANAHSVMLLRKSVRTCKKGHRFGYILYHQSQHTAYFVLNTPLSSLIPSSNRENSR